MAGGKRVNKEVSWLQPNKNPQGTFDASGVEFLQPTAGRQNPWGTSPSDRGISVPTPVTHSANHWQFWSESVPMVQYVWVW
jgi:hypothetical protein